MRNAFLRKNGLSEIVPYGRKQTTLRPDAQLILTADARTYNDTLKIYQEVFNSLNKHPLIDTLDKYAGLENFDFNFNFPSTPEDFMKSATRVDAAARVAVCRALEDSI